MGHLNRAGYEQLVNEDVAWLEKQPRTLEREHIIHVMKESVDKYYPPTTGTEYKYGTTAGLEAKLLPREPWFALRAKDWLSVEVVMHYADLCETAGLFDHAKNVRLAAMQMINWRSDNQDKVKWPD